MLVHKFTQEQYTIIGKTTIGSDPYKFELWDLLDSRGFRFRANRPLILELFGETALP